METSILNRVEKTAMLAFAFVLTGVSIVCEVLFFIEQTTVVIDTIIAAIIGGSLVCFQFLFTAVATKFWYRGSYKLASVLFVITALLFTLSLSATASFFESRFQTSQQNQIHDSNDYKLNMALINDLTTQEKTLTDSANASTGLGNAWYAGQLLEKASEASEKRQTLINKLNNATAQNPDATTALVSLIGSGRWVLWVVLAGLVDLCPLIAFTAFAINETTNIKHKTNKPPSQTKQQPQTNTKQVVRNTADIDDIKNVIKNMPSGVITVRAVMNEAKTSNYKIINKSFIQLHDEGVLTRNLKSYVKN